MFVIPTGLMSTAMIAVLSFAALCHSAVWPVACMTKPKFYAVKKGLRPGIYHTWPECQEQTKGVSGAAFKSFSTQQAANEYLESGTVPLVKRRTNKQSGGLHTSQDAVCQSSCSSDSVPGPGEAPGPSAYQRQATDAGVPAWVKPDMMYRLVYH